MFLLCMHVGMLIIVHTIWNSEFHVVFIACISIMTISIYVREQL